MGKRSPAASYGICDFLVIELAAFAIKYQPAAKDR